MIHLWLQMFGGGGSGSGAGGNKGGSNAPGHHGSVGGSGIGGAGGGQGASGKGKVSGPVATISDPKATYVLYTTRGKMIRAVAVSALLRNIREGKLHYNKNTGKWETNTGVRIEIRKRTK